MEPGPASAPTRADLERIEAALARLPDTADELAAATWLRRELPEGLARRAAELRSLRAKARARFPSGRLRFLTRRGLEQATRERVAEERARRFAEVAPGGWVFDAACGLGSDALALSRAGLKVLAGELDGETAACARDNLRSSPTPHCVFLADAARPPFRRSSRRVLLALDPDRRRRAEPAGSVPVGPAGGGEERSLDPRRWSPGPAQVAALLERFPDACVRLPAGFEVGDIPGEWLAGRPHRWQWVSEGGELCEVNLWLGALSRARRAQESLREVAVLARTGAVHRWSASPGTVVSRTPEEVSAIGWIADPDPAVVRADLVGALATELDLAPLGARCAYLGGTSRPAASACTPLVTTWRVLAQTSADARAVRRMLAEHDVGRVQVLKRGHPSPAEQLERAFSGRGAGRGHVIVARLDRGHRAFLVTPATP